MKNNTEQENTIYKPHESIYEISMYIGLFLEELDGEFVVDKLFSLNKDEVAFEVTCNYNSIKHGFQFSIKKDNKYAITDVGASINKQWRKYLNEKHS